MPHNLPSRRFSLCTAAPSARNALHPQGKGCLRSCLSFKTHIECRLLSKPGVLTPPFYECSLCFLPVTTAFFEQGVQSLNFTQAGACFIHLVFPPTQYSAQRMVKNHLVTEITNEVINLLTQEYLRIMLYPCS